MDGPWTHDAYLVLHLWVDPDGEVRGRITHPRGPGVTDDAASGEDEVATLTAEGIAAVMRRLRREAARGR